MDITDATKRILETRIPRWAQIDALRRIAQPEGIPIESIVQFYCSREIPGQPAPATRTKKAWDNSVVDEGQVAEISVDLASPTKSKGDSAYANDDHPTDYGGFA